EGLVFDPDVAGSQTKQEAAALRGVAVVWRGVDVEPDVVHVREIAAHLANEFVPGSRRAAPGSFQDPVVSESGIKLEHHLEVRVEATGCYHNSLAADGDRLTGLGIATFQTADTAALEPQRRDLRLGNDLAALLTEAFDEVSHQAQTVALGPGPA